MPLHESHVMRNIYLASAIALALANVAMTAVATTPAAAPVADLATTQLPRAVVPSHYDVAVTPHVDKMTFDGKVTVTVDVLKLTTSITLNAIDMTFSSVSLTATRLKIAIGAPKVTVDAAAQTTTFSFSQPVPAGSYTLAMSYTGKIDRKSTRLNSSH